MAHVEHHRTATGGQVGSGTRGWHLSGRALAAFGVGAGFAVMLLSGLALFVAPSGRIARTLEWQWLGLDRPGWEALHIATALLFTAVVLWHFALHLGVYRNLLRGSPARPTGHRREAAIAALAVLLVAVTALAAWPPSSWVVAAHDDFKQTGSSETGGPPWRDR